MRKKKSFYPKPPKCFHLKKPSLCTLSVCFLWGGYLNCEISWLVQSQLQNKGDSQPHLACVSQLSSAVVGHEVGNPCSWPHQVGLLSARQSEMPVLQQPAQNNKPEIPQLHSFPLLVLQVANFWSSQKWRLHCTLHECIENFSVAKSLSCAWGLPGANTSPWLSL